MNPKITIIVPVYKVEAFLHDCLNSLIAQTFSEWQAICVDDGSPDNCGKILDEYALKDNRIKVIHQENKGLSEARNAAYKYISTPYTMFLDSDDMLHHQTLELLYKRITNSEADLIWFDTILFDENETPVCKNYNHSDKLIYYKNPFKFYAIKNKLTSNKKTRMSGVVTNKIYKSEFVKKTPFAPGISPSEDNLFTLEITAKINCIAHLRQKLYFYRIRSSSIMHTLNKDKEKINNRKMLLCYPEIKKRLKEQNCNLHTLSLFERYMAENVFFKTIFRPFVKQLQTCETKDYVDNLIRSKQFDFDKIKTKYKIILFLYNHNMTKLAKLLCYI